jgi:protoporphyrinogen oxidase
MTPPPDRAAPTAHHPQLIIGAGLAGLSAALHAPRAHIIEAAPAVGGKARSEQIDGFTFDVTGHWLHLRDPEMRALVLRCCGEEHFERITRKSRVWSHGVYTHYPFQSNTYGLPPEVIRDCVMGAIRAHERLKGLLAGRDALPPDEEPTRFDEWVRLYFGDGIAERFMLPYNAKLWGVGAHELSGRWCQRFVPRPRLEEIVAGAVGCHQGGVGYNATFLYPKRGGIQSVAERLADHAGRQRITLNAPVTALSPSARALSLASGERLSYDRLISTTHLTRLIDLCGDEAPAPIREARARLRATSVTYLNVGIRGALKQPDHWVYVPEARWPMYRVGSFSNALPAMAPPGCASLYVELSDRARPLDEVIPEVIEGLVAMEMIEGAEQVMFAHPRHIPEAYVIYDEHHAEARATLHEWLASVGVKSVGRYGDWNYSSMEDALLDGRAAAEWMTARQA